MLCDNPEGWDGVGEEREGTYVHLWLIHVDVWQKPTQHCKANVLQLKNEKKKKPQKILEHLSFFKIILLSY